MNKIDQNLYALLKYEMEFCVEGTNSLSYEKIKEQLDAGLDLHKEYEKYEEEDELYAIVKKELNLEDRHAPLDVIFAHEGMSLEIIKLLHEYGAKLNFINIEHILTLNIPANDRISVLQYIHENMIPLNTILNYCKLSLIDRCYQIENISDKAAVLEWLILHSGIDIHSGNGHPILHQAIRYDLPYEHIKFLVRHNVDITKISSYGVNVLGTLSDKFGLKDCRKFVKLFCKKGIDMCYSGSAYTNQNIFYSSAHVLAVYLSGKSEKQQKQAVGLYLRNMRYLKKFMTKTQKKFVLDIQDANVRSIFNVLIKQHELFDKIIVTGNDPKIILY